MAVTIQNSEIQGMDRKLSVFDRLPDVIKDRILYYLDGPTIESQLARIDTLRYAERYLQRWKGRIFQYIKSFPCASNQVDGIIWLSNHVDEHYRLEFHCRRLCPGEFPTRFPDADMYLEGIFWWNDENGQSRLEIDEEYDLRDMENDLLRILEIRRHWTLAWQHWCEL
ncbi:hypothetical protein NEOLI_005098 [Neolecta irregularis DAH-3]|uniref:Uncharacterized protein n=1 Tax=Neolecta irregularis (strain DAH-3) TaxID=1198029 RepID=A0A1U7LIQ6_NEOID|nr:hypothetical protein NEOLI_005098 [Neolecta irregularis DAH-3]|eukprot:OLL22540.1 hypothetical protein NEOLI_005098 [Neolecta irregularis DAH-3]